MRDEYGKWTSYTEAERDELIDLFSRMENEFFSSVGDSWEISALRAAEIIRRAQERRARGIVSDCTP